MRSPPKWSGWMAGTLAATATGSLVWLSGCHGGGPNPDLGGNPDLTTNNPDMLTGPGPAVPTTAKSVATIDRPLAAVVSPDGKTVYLTAHDAKGLPQLYSVPASGGTPALIATSKATQYPLGMALSPDGKTLYIADGAGGTEDAGVVYSSDTTGNISANAFDGIRAPGGVAVSSDGKTVYATGFDKTDGMPGLFQANSTGGTFAAVAKGAPFANPSAVTVTTDGTIYVVDATARGPRQGAVIKVSGGAASILSKTPLSVGYPAGISPVGIGYGDLLVTGNIDSGGMIYRVTAAGDASQLVLGGPTFFDPSTIHRAASADVWIAIDSVNATQPSPSTQVGTVFQLVP